MKYPFITLARQLPTALLCSALTACAAGGSRQSKAASARESDEATSVESEEAENPADVSEERVEAQAAGSPAPEMHTAEEKSAPSGESDFSTDSERPSTDAPPASEPKQKKERPLTEALRLHALDLDKLLDAETQSCDGAKPHQDAICSIAERICEMESPSTTKSADCSRARESCEKARKQYQKKCS